MKKVVVSLTSDDKSIEYLMDLDAATFESAMSDPSGKRTVVQVGSIGTSDAEKLDLALRIYHILLAALRAHKNEGL